MLKRADLIWIEFQIDRCDWVLIWFSDSSCLSPPNECGSSSDFFQLYSPPLWMTLTPQSICLFFAPPLSPPSLFKSPLLQPLLYALLLLCPSYPFLFLQPLLSTTLCALILNSTCVFPCLFIPLSSSCPCQTLSNPPNLLCCSMVHLLHPCPQGICPRAASPPTAVPAVAVPTYPAGWRCTAGWQSEPPCWVPLRRETPRLGTSWSCRGVGKDKPAGSRCWCRSATAPRHPTPLWAARTAPGSSGWNVSF